MSGFSSIRSAVGARDKPKLFFGTNLLSHVGKNIASPSTGNTPVLASSDDPKTNLVDTR